ncbi:hypothetical protein BKA66DRAFT_448856 [Pyrenochaeta sp. MPI-SDFR-AT-0127]|nr:hypothetical protein BKA66DRAFT_448856 [Pyrenochaeta sp. MPI-SDFR-AT-0127]
MDNLTSTVSTHSYSDLAFPSASKFLGLPLKVRLQVYRYLAPQHDGTMMDWSSPGIVRQEPRPCSLAPLLVCSQIYKEAISIWYKYAVFRLAGSKKGLRNKHFFKKNKPGSKHAVSTDRYPLPLSNLHLCVNIELDLHFHLPPTVQLTSAERTESASIQHLVNILTARKNRLRHLAIRPVFTSGFRAQYFKLDAEGINPNTATQPALHEAVDYNLRLLKPLYADQVVITLQDKWVASMVKRSMDRESQLSARSRMAQEQMDKFMELCQNHLKIPKGGGNTSKSAFL